MNFKATHIVSAQELKQIVADKQKEDEKEKEKQFEQLVAWVNDAAYKAAHKGEGEIEFTIPVQYRSPWAEQLLVEQLQAQGLKVKQIGDKGLGNLQITWL